MYYVRIDSTIQSIYRTLPYRPSPQAAGAEA